jgi:DNA-binding transcriptional MerR regulator
MNLQPIASARTALNLYEPDPARVYSIEAVSLLTHVPRRLIAVYYRHGLVSPIMDPDGGGWYFNDEGVRRLRRIEYLRASCGMNLSAIQMMLDLTAEVERLRRELRFFRGQ